MVFGEKEGKVLAYTVDTGYKLWEYDAEERVYATPGTTLGQFIFVVSKTHIQVLNATNGDIIMDNGQPRKEEFRNPTYASPAVSANLVYIAASRLLTRSYDLNTRAQDESFFVNGYSSPAIGEDGSVYIVGLDRKVRKYTNQP